MSYESRAYDNEHGDPVVVLVTTGTHDVSRLVNLLAGSRLALCEHIGVSEDILRQVKRHSGGRAALKLLAAHGGPDLSKVPAKYAATGIGTTTTDATGEVVLNIDTPDGPVHIDLGTEFAEPLGLLLLDDPEHGDGAYCPDDVAGGAA
ncbi:hypothetical protein AB0L65_32800 [Nonomuraea sp. NPDC052116]|uniref:hypothetical protein n=1 Tax=Nonomuraea sp. NPDC052116 TaxID=3155665 RepID=UPI003420A172